MDRLRAGLTGLGAVFLLTLGASLAFGHPGERGAPTETAKEPGEPLAQLGVAPGSEKPAPETPAPYADAAPSGLAPDAPGLSDRDTSRDSGDHSLLPPGKPDSPVALAPVAPPLQTSNAV